MLLKFSIFLTKLRRIGLSATSYKVQKRFTNTLFPHITIEYSCESEYVDVEEEEDEDELVLELPLVFTVVVEDPEVSVQLSDQLDESYVVWVWPLGKVIVV